MRIVDLTLAEAADPAVMKNVAEFLLMGSHTAIYTPAPPPIQVDGVSFEMGNQKFVGRNDTPKIPISPADLPDAGLPPVPGAPTSAAHAPAAPVTLPQVPAPSPATPDPSTIGFGAQVPQPPAPTIPAIPTVPAAPAAGAVPLAPAPSSAPASGVVVDKDGFPWNAKIHATTKATNKDGTWRKRQGVAAELIASEEALMRQVMAIPAPAAQLPLAPTVPAPPATPLAALQAAVGGDPFLTVPDNDKFKVWMEELTPAMTKGVITPTFMTKYLTEPLGTYAMRPDLVPQAREAVRAGLRAEFPADAY